jgi:hypothetical protein
MEYGYNYNSALSKRQRLDVIEAQLRNERTSFRNYWRELSDYILPRRGRFFVSDVNDGQNKRSMIIDATASMAARTLSSGMMTGVTSPARQWFKLTTSEEDLNEQPDVKAYLKDVGDKIRMTFLKSNLYNVLPTLYADLGTFGTGCIFMEEDFESTVNFISFPIGSFMIANDKRGKVSVFFREFQMTVRQIVDKFGRTNPNDPTFIDWSNISDAVKNQYMKHQHETQVDICHFILPNEQYSPNKMESKFKRYQSLYYEKGISSTNNSSSYAMSYPDKFLSEKGYDFFPVMAVRWEVAGEDTYGTNCPGMVSLGDVKQLQLAEKRIAAALDQKVKPSMVGPTSLKNAKASILPGDITYLDEREGTRGFRRLFEIDFDIRELEGKQEQVRIRISKAFYEDLFLMLANTNRRQITAREVEERHEEKLLALGPVLERINQDLLDPLIENTFAIMDKQGILPEPPDSLAGREYTIEYVSVMAQAQKLAGIGNIERMAGFVAQVASLDPSVINKFDIEEAIEVYGDLVGVDPNLIKSKEEVEAIKAEQAAQQAQMQQMAAASEMVNAGKALSETKMDEDTALAQLIGG